ncbi:MAG: hypothetical protein ABIF77_17495 [bacterium]
MGWNRDGLPGRGGRFWLGWLVLLSANALTAHPPAAELPLPPDEAVVTSVESATDRVQSELYAGFRPLLHHELESRQVASPDDLYKFLFQGVMGPAHAHIDEDLARGWLEREWDELPSIRGTRPPGSASGPAAADSPLLELLRPDHQLVRVNLHPLRELVRLEVPEDHWDSVESAARERLAVAFARTADLWASDLLELRTVWALVVADSALWSAFFTATELAEFTRQVESAGWPAVHHSNSYETRWSPHYRVVALELLPPSWREHVPGRTATLPATEPEPDPGAVE